LRLLVGTSLVLLVTLTAAFLLVNRALTGSFQDFLDDQLTSRLQRAESILTRFYDRRRDWNGVEANIQSVADLMGERLVLADAQGLVVADSQSTLVGHRASESWSGRRVPIRFQEKAVGTLYVSPLQSGERVIDTRGRVFLTTVNSYLVWAAGVGLIATLALTFAVARWLAGPIEALTRAAGRMERGDLEQRIETTVGGEVGALADAFNSLATSLSRVEQLRRTMVSDIAHELRTPLSSIRGYIEAIQDGLVQADEETLATLHREMLQLTRIIDDLQELTLAEARQLPLDRQETDLAELIEWEVRAFRPRALSREVEIDVDSSGLRAPVWVDAGRMSQVIANILRNALAYTPQGGRVSMRAWSDGNQAHVAVADTGVGIEQDELPHVFERFYRTDKARSRRRGGSGLGLTIARELARAHGGTIGATSTVGQGSCFTVSLPVGPPSAPATSEARADAAARVAAPRSGLSAVVWRGVAIGAVAGGIAGMLESTLAAVSTRRPSEFIDLFGYAILIDGAVFAALLGFSTLVAAMIARARGAALERGRTTVWLSAYGIGLAGLLLGYRWVQAQARDVEIASPEMLYPLAMIVCASLLLAVVAAFALDVARTRWPAPRQRLVRRMLPLALVALVSSSTVLVGRDQLLNQLAVSPASPSPNVVGRRASTPRSPAARPTSEPGSTGSPAFNVDQPSRPNVLLITVSGLRADHVGAYGYENARTPSIDNLARSGTLFTAALTPQPDTNAAHASILTGLLPSRTGIRTDLVDRLEPSTRTVAQQFADRGYRTGAIYSWVSFEPAYSGLDRGFHDYLDLTINRPEYLADDRAQAIAATYERLKAHLAVPAATGAFTLDAGLSEAIDSRADVTSEAAIAWIEENRNTPFFLWVHFYDPNKPYTPPPSFRPLPSVECLDACPDGSSETVRWIEAGAQLSAAQVNHLTALYHGEVAFTDQQIGRLLSRIRELGLAANTAVALTADHGQSFAEHDSWFGNSALYGAQTRVPLIVSTPGGSPSRIVTAPVATTHLGPTLLDIAGIAGLPGVDGVSLLPSLRDSTRTPPGPAVSELRDRSQLAVLEGTWKLIWSDEDGGRAQLFNVIDDPMELNDRAEDEPDVVARLRAVVDAWRAGRPG
jgi:signal transduction histidine kinase/arylsulfatase A-like enzyme